ncbi:unnamed protein product [Psylliodes chrysocephalus]|uniref:DUF4371 domain-containing protein n=1 Tax=Psylliodes chrysocephalus TaxID=3402493 RepID=A0A9P0D406_9CUCU|nr:unnamed protein product [Psylliodes chrysocephala]
MVKTNVQKVISQSYDGAAVMSGKINGVQAKVRSKFVNAYYTLCYAHQLNLVMSQSASSNKSAKVFFANLSAIPTFFSNSPARLSALDESVARRIPSVCTTRWNYQSRAVDVVSQNR